VICDPWIDRTAPRSPRTGKPFKTSYNERKRRTDRRAELEAANKCINGPLVGNVGKTGIVHGEPVKHGKCARCVIVYADSKDLSS
jgi:hypothetical protein